MMRLRPLILLLACLAGGTAHAAPEEAVDAASGTVRLLLSTEPPSLDSVRATDQVSFFVLSHLMDGLLQYDADNRLAPALAERWELRPDGATFWLRRGATWEDGAPVTAHDFVHAWREVLRPANAAPYASLLYPVRNARAIASGELAPESLGATAPEDHRLEVVFGQPCAWFPALTAFMTLLPLRADFHAAQGGVMRPTRADCSRTARSASPAGCTARSWCWRRTRATGMPAPSACSASRCPTSPRMRRPS